MRVVIDSNRVQTPELAKFLAAMPCNRAVVTDWLMMEAYKGDTASSIYKSLAVLGTFPEQVIVLRNTGHCMRKPVGLQMANRLIWTEHTKTFSAFIAELEAAKTGDEVIAAAVLERGALATRRMNVLLENAAQLSDGNKAMLQSLRPDDILAIRRNTEPPPGLLSRIFSIAQDVADGYRQTFGGSVKAEHGKHQYKDFLFRVGLAQTASFLDWVSLGSPTSVKAEKVRNDYVDAMLSVYGTYFNGLMTGDAKLLRIHSLNRRLLEIVGESLPTSYSIHSPP